MLWIVHANFQMDENPSENILDFFSKIKNLNVMFVVYYMMNYLFKTFLHQNLIISLYSE